MKKKTGPSIPDFNTNANWKWLCDDETLNKHLKKKVFVHLEWYFNPGFNPCLNKKPPFRKQKIFTLSQVGFYLFIMQGEQYGIQ